MMNRSLGIIVACALLFLWPETLLHSADGSFDQDNSDPLGLSVEPERDQLLCCETLEVLVLLENRSKDPVEDVERGVELQISKDGGDWQGYSPPSPLIDPVLPRKLVRPAGDRQRWSILISTNDSKGLGSKTHAFSGAGKYRIRAISSNNLHSVPVEIVVAVPTNRTDQQALEVVRESGVSRWFSWVAPILRSIPDEELTTLRRIRSQFSGSVFADHATWALAIAQWRGAGSRNEAEALNLAEALAAREGSPIRIRGYLLLAEMSKLEEPETAKGFLDKALELSPGAHNRYLIEVTRLELAGKPRAQDSAQLRPLGANPLTANRNPLEWMGCIVEPENGAGEGWVVSVQTVKEIPAPWLPVRIALTVGNAADSDAAIAKDLHVQLETRKKGAAEWHRHALKPPRKGLIHWRDEERIFRANERKIWEATLHLEHGGKHAFEEPGDYEIRVVLGDLKSQETPVRVKQLSDSDASVLKRIRERALVECLGFGPGFSALAQPSVRNDLSSIAREAPSSVYTPHLQLGLAWDCFVSSFDKVGPDSVPPERSQAVKIIDTLCKREDAIGAEANTIMATVFTKREDRKTRARLLEQAMNRSPDPGLVVRIRRFSTGPEK